MAVTPTNAPGLISRIDELTASRIRALSRITKVTLAPSRVLIVRVWPSTLSIVPRMRTFDGAAAASCADAGEETIPANQSATMMECAVVLITHLPKDTADNNDKSGANNFASSVEDIPTLAKLPVVECWDARLGIGWIGQFE